MRKTLKHNVRSLPSRVYRVDSFCCRTGYGNTPQQYKRRTSTLSGLCNMTMRGTLPASTKLTSGRTRRACCHAGCTTGRKALGGCTTTKMTLNGHEEEDAHLQLHKDNEDNGYTPYQRWTSRICSATRSRWSASRRGAQPRRTTSACSTRASSSCRTTTPPTCSKLAGRITYACAVGYSVLPSATTDNMRRLPRAYAEARAPRATNPADGCRPLLSLFVFLMAGGGVCCYCRWARCL